jgi:ribonuclease P protein component
VLPAAARLRRRRDFSTVLRHGRRVRRPLLTVIAWAEPAGSGSPRVGFAVGRACGNSVRRHRLARRLRHLVRERLDRLPPGVAVVVRASPAAADSPTEELAADLDRALAGAAR